MPKYIEEKELREWVQNWFEKNRYYHPYSRSNDIPIPELYDILERMPTADVPERNVEKWIPVSEKLPKNDDWVIVTILDESGDTPFRYSDFGWYLEEANCWIVAAEQRTDIIAWMPLPEPYRERKKDAEVH